MSRAEGYSVVGLAPRPPNVLKLKNWNPHRSPGFRIASRRGRLPRGTRIMKSSIRYNPPQNFGMVEEDLYRSSCPGTSAFPFLETLSLRTIIYLSPDRVPDALSKFCEEQKIRLIRPSGAEKQHQSSLTATIAEEAVIESLDTLLDPKHYPTLVTCKLGRHKTGTVIGCLRKLQRWSLSSILAEYRHYADRRLQNEQFIELFDSDLIRVPEKPVQWFRNLREVQREILSREQKKLLGSGADESPGFVRGAGGKEATVSGAQGETTAVKANQEPPPARNESAASGSSSRDATT